MHLTPSESEKLLLAVAGMVARDRRERGVRLNYPETVALLSLLPLALWLSAVFLVRKQPGLVWPQWAAAVVVAAGLTLLLVRRCTSRLGGVTGDVLGAGVETSLAVLLLALA